MDRTRFWVRFKDGRIATEQTEWADPLDQLAASPEVVCGWLDLQSPYAVDLEELHSTFGIPADEIASLRQPQAEGQGGGVHFLARAPWCITITRNEGSAEARSLQRLAGRLGGSTLETFPKGFEELLALVRREAQGARRCGGRAWTWLVLTLLALACAAAWANCQG